MTSLDTRHPRPDTSPQTEEEIPMDELLKLLRNNALESPQDLAKMLGCSASDVKTRISEYEERGIIRGYKALINEDQLDLQSVRAVIEVKISPEREGGFDRIAARIGKFTEVESLFLMSGAYDVLVFVRGRSLQEVLLRERQARYHQRRSVDCDPLYAEDLQGSRRAHGRRDRRRSPESQPVSESAR